MLGSGCGSVGRAVTSDSRGPQFESIHWYKFIMKKQNKEKETENGPFKKD